MDPTSVLYSWQALVVASAVVVITSGVKATIDVIWGKYAPEETPTVKDMVKVGATKRKANLWLTEVVVPGLPVLVGALFAAGVPVRPDVLIEYTEAHVAKGAVLVYMAWGAAVGSLSTYLYDRARGTVRAVRGGE